ncbi:MAG: efflux RND transporter permease subunit [Gammaproteobacteria bacterium]|nr:MAG: efflux RND transporter permease subunit [Gammaproteobacteria bacterium]
MKHDRGGFIGAIIAWFVQNPVAANLLMLSGIMLGVLALSDLRKEAFPSLEPDVVTVTVSYDSGDPVLAEEGVAIKVEEALEGLPGIKRVTSVSTASGSNITIEKQTDYSLDKLLTDIKNEVDAISNFPADADNPVIEKERRRDNAIRIQLYGDADRKTLQQLAEQLKDDLLGQSAIADVSLSGKADPMVAIEVDEAKLQALGLTFSDVAAAVNAESDTPNSTSLRNPEKVVRLKVARQAYTVEDFRRIPLLTTEDGAVIRLGDVADVQDTFEDDTFVLSRYNGQNGILVQVSMDETGDIMEIVDQAKHVVDTWTQSGRLPQGVHLATWLDQSSIIKSRLELLIRNALSGIALVFIILALFLNLRVAFWVAAGLPFVFFGTLYFMTDTWAALTINQLTTFGFIMALGIVVDDAIVIGESVYATRAREGETLASTLRGTLRVAIPTIFGVLTTIVAFMSLSNVTGHLGKVFAQFGSIVMICLLLSLVESMLILPAHLAHLPTGKSRKQGLMALWGHVQHGAEAGLAWFGERIYRPVIARILQFRYAVVLVFVAFMLLVLGLPMSGAVRVGFFPNIAGDTIRAQIDMQSDASFGLTRDALLSLETLARQADETLVQANGGSGTGIKGLQVSASADDSGDVIVELTSDAPYGSREFAREWRRYANGLEGVRKLSVDAQRQMLDNFKVELRAADDTTVTEAGKAFREALSGVPGVLSIEDNMDPGDIVMRFELTEQGRALGLTTEMLSSQVLSAYGGATVQRFQRDNDEVKVRLRYPSEVRQTPADVLTNPVRLSDGTVVPLSVVANVRFDNQTDEVTRIDGQRAVYVSAVLDKDTLAPNELVASLRATLVPELEKQFPNLSIHFAGEAEAQEETTASMITLFTLAMLGIYVLLAIPLKSYVQPLLIMTAIPFGVVGAILGHWWNDLTISLLSMNGILALSGVVVNDSLLLVSRFNELRDDLSLSVREAIEEACAGRLRAVLLTSITTYAGLVPLLSETSVQAQFLIPAAASLGYGILFATLITLILLPALLGIREDAQRWLAWLKGKLQNTLTDGREEAY